MQKSTIIHNLNKPPKKFDLDDFLKRLIVIEKIDEGMEEAKAGKTVSHDKIKKMVTKRHK